MLTWGFERSKTVASPRALAGSLPKTCCRGWLHVCCRIASPVVRRKGRSDLAKTAILTPHGRNCTKNGRTRMSVVGQGLKGQNRPLDQKFAWWLPEGAVVSRAELAPKGACSINSIALRWAQRVQAADAMQFVSQGGRRTVSPSL